MAEAISIHTGDVHLCDLKPIARQEEPDWYMAQIRTLRWLLELSESMDCDVFIGGDLFDKPTLSFHFLNALWVCFNNRYKCLIGNHEQPDKHIGESINSSVWTTGGLMGLYKGFTAGYAVDSSGVANYGMIPATNSEEEFLQYVRQTQDADVIVMHKYVWSDISNSYNGASDKGNAKHISSLFPNAKAIFCSDNHIGFECPEYRLYNCGALIRHNADQVNYQPRVYVLYDDFSVKRVDVPIDNDLITDKHIKDRKQLEDKEDMFIRTLSDSKDISLSFSDNLKRRLENQRCKEYITTLYKSIKDGRTE